MFIYCSEVSTRGLNNTFMQLRKICNHPYLFYDQMDGFDWDTHKTTEVRCADTAWDECLRLYPLFHLIGDRAVLW